MLIALFYTLSFIVIIGTLLPLVRKDHWTFRVFEFPRLQKLLLLFAAAICGAFLYDQSVVVDVVLGALFFNGIYLCYLIYPFTPLAAKTLVSAKRHESAAIRLLIANVYQPNRDFSKMIKRIKETEPDVLMLVETDADWCEALKDYTLKYPYRIENPRDNTYGMLLYSKFKLEESEVRHLVKEDYPSIKTKLRLPDGRICWFYGLHPPPPSPTEKTYSTARDSELMIVAREVKTIQNDPIIVAGDLNDVAWSYTTDQFIEKSGLKDPRKGRGIYATFNAKNIFMRWPLDHIFCSSHFRLLRLKRRGKTGSDHFPVLVELSLDS